MKVILTNFVNFFKKHKKILLYAILLIFLSVGVSMCVNEIGKLGKLKTNVEYDDASKIHHVVYSEGNFSDLKKENKELYDSLKKYKKQIDFLTSFDYQKEYKIEKTVVNNSNKKQPLYTKDTDGNYKEYTEATTYEYKNEPNDSIEYKLKINSYTEPNWYSLDVKMHDKITIVDKDNKNGTHTLDIGTKNKATIPNATVYKKKRNFWSRFSVGPSVSVGYDPFHKNLGMTIGVGATFDLTK
jgi:hypothetical protein